MSIVTLAILNPMANATRACAPSWAITLNCSTSGQRNGMITTASAARPISTASLPDSGARVPGAGACAAYIYRACAPIDAAATPISGVSRRVWPECRRSMGRKIGDEERRDYQRKESKSKTIKWEADKEDEDEG